MYIRGSLTSGEPTDVLNYKSRYPDFPQQSTADQWFTESQFEGYRALGEHIIECVLHGLPKPLPRDPDKKSWTTCSRNSKNPGRIASKSRP
jgi:hypothetical protein